MMVKVIARLIIPQVMNMLVNPLCCIQGEIAKGIPMPMALRRNVTPVKASPVI
jgi:hypothetical protein